MSMSRFALLIVATIVLAFLTIGPGLAPAWAQAGQPIAIVAAENFYGDVAQQIGGPR